MHNCAFSSDQRLLPLQCPVCAYVFSSTWKAPLDCKKDGPSSRRQLPRATRLPNSPRCWGGRTPFLDHPTAFSSLFLLFFLKMLFIYLFMRDAGEAKTQAEGEAGPPWGAPCGTHPGTPGSRRAEGVAEPLSCLTAFPANPAPCTGLQGRPEAGQIFQVRKD